MIIQIKINFLYQENSIKAWKKIFFVDYAIQCNKQMIFYTSEFND